MTQKQSNLSEISEKLSGTQYQLLSSQSFSWLQEKIKEIRNFSRERANIAAETFRYKVKRFRIGKLFFFFYDPKGKNDLPYYDIFPLVIILKKYDDGFLGLNLHYLPLIMRIRFLNKLLKLAKFSDENEIEYMRISYDILNATNKYKEFRPCIKRYLYSHIRSKLLEVQPNEWEVAAHLPIHSFKKAGAPTVWKDSKEKIKQRDEE
jgi:hypothetical protein